MAKKKDKPAFATIEALRDPPIPRVYVVVYIACIALAALSDWPAIIEKGMYLKILSLGGFGLALLRLVWTNDRRRFKLLGRLLLIFMIPLAFVYVLSLCIWTAKLMDTMYISRATSKILFQCVNVAALMGAGYLFGSRAADYTLWGLAIGNMTMILIEMVQFGVGKALMSIAESFAAFSNASGFMYKIEIHDVTFCMGLFVLYYIFAPRGTKGRWMNVAIAGFFFVIGFKRIAMLGIAVSVALALLMDCCKYRRARVITAVLQSALIVISYFYIYIITEGIWTEIMTELEVDMAGRDRIYRYMSQFYTLSPEYTGFGFEYTVAMLRAMRDSGTWVIHATGVHCDILKQYIELGFWGYLAWMLYTYLFQALWYGKNFGKRPMILFVSTGLYAWITYMTDNTIYYFWLSMCLKLLMMSYVFGQEEREQAARKTDIHHFELEDIAPRRREA